MCKDCRNPIPNIVEEFASGDLVCGDCGLILGDRIIDTRSEWRTFANDEGDDPSRVGAAANPLLEGNQLDTGISKLGVTSAAGKDMIRFVNRANNNKGIRGRLQAFKDIAAMCEAANYSKPVIEKAKAIYKLAEESKSISTKKTEVIIAACIFMACRREGVPRTFKEISSLARVTTSDIGKAYKTLKRNIDDEGEQTTTSTADLMPRFCSLLNLPMEVQNAASNLAQSATNIHSVAGRSPVSIAAAAIYFMSHLFQQGRSLKQISDVSGVSSSTIKSAYKTLANEKTTLVDINQFQAKVSFAYLPPC
ncbi:cyclin-like protein [Neoconidiobolus thromboides FSU 785]|nr:cyclin-like protein [Neoconidiobolus thromboides FSU 785]